MAQTTLACPSVSTSPLHRCRAVKPPPLISLRDLGALTNTVRDNRTTDQLRTCNPTYQQSPLLLQLLFTLSNMKVFAFVFLVLGVAMVSAAPQDINSAILAVINSAVPNVQPGSFARPPPGGVSSFATAQQNTNPSGQTFFAAQTGVSQGRPVRK